MKMLKSTVLTAILVISSLFVFSAIHVSASPSDTHKILVVCSDVDDVMFANSLGVKEGFSVDILYLGKDIPDDRHKLSNIIYLIKYDEIWIPDLNSEWTYGGRLNREEINALKEYVKNGGILILGLNTYTQSWSKSFEEITGTRLIRIEKPVNDSREWNIVYNGRVYVYNGTYQVAVVDPYRAHVIARYTNSIPAVTLSKFNRGVGVLITFNPVKELIFYPEIMGLYFNISSMTLNERDSSPSLPISKMLILWIKRIVFHPISIGLMVFLVLESMAYFGLLPFTVTSVLAISFMPFSKFFFKSPFYRRTLETIYLLGGVTFSDLSKELNIKRRRLKFPLSLMVLMKKVNILDMTLLEAREVLIVPWGLEAEGVAAWAVKKYPNLMRMIVKEPGIPIIELAHRVNIPPYDVLRLLRELSRYGIVELRKIVVDYEAYPMRALMRWFEE